MAVWVTVHCVPVDCNMFYRKSGRIVFLYLYLEDSWCKIEKS